MDEIIMKTLTSLLTLIAIGVASSSFASELTQSLEGKITVSDLIIVGTVTSVTRSKIKQEKHIFTKTQQVELKLKVTETIFGKKESEVTVTCYSVQYSKKTKDGGVSSHNCTAGFSGYGIIKGQKYIAYLKKKDGKYYLSGNSNQYLEEIDDSKGTARDIGQTGDVVPLKEKLEKLRELAKKKEKSTIAKDKKDK
jgi:hypothetical protein